MNIRHIIFLFICSNLTFDYAFGQDTIYVDNKPKVIIKSWYPEFKDFPNLIKGNSNLLYIKIPVFENLPIRDNDVDIHCLSKAISIVENEDKKNQFVVTVNDTFSGNEVEFEIWFALEDKVIIWKNGSTLVDLSTEFPFKDARILIQKIKLKIAN